MLMEVANAGSERRTYEIPASEFSSLYSDAVTASKSGVFTIKKRTYQVCLNCGQEFDYSRARMRSIRSSVGDIPMCRRTALRPNEAPVS